MDTSNSSRIPSRHPAPTLATLVWCVVLVVMGFLAPWIAQNPLIDPRLTTGALALATAIGAWVYRHDDRRSWYVLTGSMLLAGMLLSSSAY
jgi:hypothetical protein